MRRFYVETSCNDRNGDGEGCGIRPAKMDKLFQVLFFCNKLQNAAFVCIDGYPSSVHFSKLLKVFSSLGFVFNINGFFCDIVTNNC